MPLLSRITVARAENSPRIARKGLHETEDDDGALRGRLSSWHQKPSRSPAPNQGVSSMHLLGIFELNIRPVSPDNPAEEA